MAKPTPSMPNEILDRILGFSSRIEHLQARLDSRELYAISTVNLFRLKRFYPSAETGEKFPQLLSREASSRPCPGLGVIGGPPVRQSESWKI